MSALSLLIFPAIGFRIFMESYPTLLLCCLFWGCLILGNIAAKNYWILPGIGCNAAATTANGGVMPVYGQEVTKIGIHVQGTPDMALQFLCDRFWGFSLGDIFLAAGLVAAIAIYTYRNITKMTVANSY